MIFGIEIIALLIAVVLGAAMTKRASTAPSTALRIEMRPSASIFARYDNTTDVRTHPAFFATRVTEFFTTHHYALKRTAPPKLNYVWWRIIVPGTYSTPFQLAISFLDTDIDGREGDFELQASLFRTADTIQMTWKLSGTRPTSFAALEIVEYTMTELRSYFLETSAGSPSGVARPASVLAETVSPIELPKPRIPRPVTWPTPQDYNEAMQNPKANLGKTLLQEGRVELNSIGLPKAASGAFASVYKLTAKQESYALKCFFDLADDQKERFSSISKYVLSDDLEYTVDFDYIDKGVLVRGHWYPILCMPWVHGIPLNFYVQQHLSNPERILDLSQKFVEMMTKLNAAGIAHGDLQHGNILVTDEGIRLVDYDGMFVPGMESMTSNELGHRNYQHPGRQAVHFGPWLDNFSAWLIYCSLRALAIDSALWYAGAAGDETLLMRKTDYTDPQNSEVFRQMDRRGERLATIGMILRDITELPITDVPNLEPGTIGAKLSF